MWISRSRKLNFSLEKMHFAPPELAKFRGKLAFLTRFSEGKSKFKDRVSTDPRSISRGKRGIWPQEFSFRADLDSMGSFQSFAEMLEKKIRKEIEREYFQTESSQESSTADFTAETWTRLVGELGTIHFHPSQKAAAYHRNRPVPKPRPPHQFTMEQEKAWAFFQGRLEVPLAPNFSREDLKRSFRALAMRLHPDHGGTSSQIQELLVARQQLEKLFI